MKASTTHNHPIQPQRNATKKDANRSSSNPKQEVAPLSTWPPLSNP